MSVFAASASAHVDVAHRHDLPLVVVRLCRQAHGQRHRAHAAGEHDQHIQDLCAGIQLAGDTHRQAHRAEGRAGLKDGVDDRHGVRGVIIHHHRRAESCQRTDDDDGHGAVHGLRFDVVFRDHAVVAALGHTADGQDDDRKGGHLHAAARGAGGRTDELQHAHEQLGDGTAGGKVDGVHACSTGGHGLEQGRHQLAGHAQAPHAGGVVPLHQRDECRTAEPQDHREAQHHLRLQGQPVLFVELADLHPDHKAQAARNDHEYDDRLHIVVVHIGHQRGILPEPAEQVKARVAEGRNGREHADPDALQPELRHKGEQQQQDADAFKQRRQAHHRLQHFLCLRVAVRRDALAHQPQVPEAHAPPHGQCKKAGEGDQAQAAHLNEHQDHGLSEVRELGPGVPHDQTGDAGGAGGREQRIHHAQPALLAGKRCGEQQRAQRDDHQKAHADDLRRVRPAAALARRVPKQPVFLTFFHKLLRTRQTAAAAFIFSLLIEYTFCTAGST